jgi:phosphatidylglycerophosphatase A
MSVTGRSPAPPLPIGVWRDPVRFLALGFGTGLLPRAPGTYGTLIGIPVYLAISMLTQPIYIAGVAALFLVGIYLCAATARHLGVHDHPAIVWDEIVGYLVTMAFVAPTWINIALGFALFRFFDIVKPWPVRIADRRVHGGFGIMLDDLLAGLYAALVLWGIGYL